MKDRTWWAASAAFVMFMAFWGLTFLLVGSSELFGINARGYHQGDYTHQKYWYLALSIALSLAAGVVGWKARGWYPPKVDESNETDEEAE